MRAVLILILASVAQAVIIPTSIHQERPVMVAKLKALQSGDAHFAYSITLNRPAASRKATSFTFYEGRNDVRCGRCMPVPQVFQVVAYEEDRCGNISYHAVRREHVQFTDDEPDTLGHLAAEIVVEDHSGSVCEGSRRDWEVEHVCGNTVRNFEGEPEALLTIQ